MQGVSLVGKHRGDDAPGVGIHLTRPPASEYT